nr:MAG: hypothetical protein 1 [Leviviridae sp.]
MVSFPQNRHRENEYGVNTGYITVSGTKIPQTRLEERWVCDDVIGNKGKENPLSLYKKLCFGAECTDFLPPTGFFFEGVPVDLGGPSPKADIQLGGPNLGTYANRIMAQSGPKTAAVNLPVALFELKDLPKMLKHAGDLLHGIRSAPSGLSPGKEAASATLAAQFGWLPLIGDISKLMNLSKIIANRQKILQGAHSEKGIRRKVTLDSGSGPGYSGDYYAWSTYGRLITVHFTQKVEYKTWGVCHWRVRNPALIGKPPDFQDAFNDALGLSKGYIPISVWKAMPWSWAFDWFAGISDLINAGHNYIDYEPFNITAMRTSRSFVSTDQIVNGLYTLTRGYKQETWKERAVLPPVPWPNVKLPFLDNFKLSILGSFAILGLYRA